MNPQSTLANHVERTVTGPMWHGPALHELLQGVTHEQAAARPIAGAHTIWELVLHVTAWVDIARERLRNRALESPTPEGDWPPVPPPTEAAWSEAVAKLAASHEALAQDVLKWTPEALTSVVPVSGPRYTVATLLHGVIEHGTYHGGQIALLKRALST